MAERSWLLSFFKRRVARLVDRLESSSDRIQLGARSHARRDVPDEVARDALRDELREFPVGRVEAELSSWWPRDTFVDDRAYRLLVAIRDRSPVPEIELSQRELFAQEQRLGRLPLPDAFAQLAELDPTLRTLEKDPQIRKPKALTRVVRQLEKNPSELLSGKLARSIVVCHLGQQGSGRSYNPTPILERNQHHIHGSLGLSNQRASARDAATDGPSEDIIVCPDEETAQKVAKQQSLEQQDSVWIYRQESGQWLARRWR
jgi:hypothetical protein